MKNKLKGFIIGVLVTIMLMSTVAFGQGIKQKIEVLFNSVNLTVNGQEIKTDNILYNGTTYVPLRAVADVLGKEVGWDQKTNTASINDKGFASQTTSNNNNKNIYSNLSEQDIQSAIQEGKKGVISAITFGNENYNLEKLSGDDYLMDNAQINTPYLGIVYESALKSAKYQDVTDEEINQIIKELENVVYFTVDMFGRSIDFTKFVHIVLKQGDKVIQASNITGTDDWADRSSNWPSFPAYKATFGAEFSSRDIDFNKQAELIAIYAGGIELKYKVDFSKYK